MKTAIYTFLLCAGMILATGAARADVETITIQPAPNHPIFYPYRSSSCGYYDGCREYETRGIWKRFDTERGYPWFRKYYSPYGQPGEIDPYRYEYRTYYHYGPPPNRYEVRVITPYRYPNTFNAYRYNYRPEQPIYPIYPFYR